MNEGWSRATRYLVLIIVLMGLVWLLFAIRALIGPLAIATLLAYVLNPAVTLTTDILCGSSAERGLDA